MQRAATSLLCEAALLCDDEFRLQRGVPYLLTQISDPSAAVRCAGLVACMCAASMLSGAPTRRLGMCRHHEFAWLGTPPYLPALSSSPWRGTNGS